MWLGPGGVIALLLGGWGWLWAAYRTPGRPWTDWFLTAASVVALQIALGAITTQAWLVLAYADAARALSVPEKQVLLEMMRPSYGPILWSCIGAAVVGVGLVRVRAGWTSASGRPSGITLGLVAALGLLLTGSLATIVAFYGVYERGGAESANRQGAQLASEILLSGSVLGYAALLLASFILIARGGRALRA